MTRRDKIRAFRKWFKKLENSILGLVIFGLLPMASYALDGHLIGIVCFVASGVILLATYITMVIFKRRVRIYEKELAYEMARQRLLTGVIGRGRMADTKPLWEE